MFYLFAILRNMKIFYLIPVILLVVLIYQLISKGIAGTEDPLPKEFVSYHSIDDSATISVGKLEMSLMLHSKKNISLFLTSANNVILSSFSADKVNSFIKISPDGNVTDTLELISRPEDIIFLKGFIIDKQAHQYYNWSFNDIKTPIGITAENLSFNWDSGQQIKKLKEIVNQSKTVYVDYAFDSPVPQKQANEGLQTKQSVSSYAIVTYFLKDKCFQLYTTEDVRKYFSSSYLQEMRWSNLFKRINKDKADNEEIIKTPNLSYRYFQKLKLEKVKFSGGGGNAPGFTKLLYPGYLFTDVIFKSDTLKLKEFMYLDKDWHTSAVEIDGQNIGSLSKNKAQPVEHINAYMYYTNENLHYALFSNSDKKLYIIK